MKKLSLTREAGAVAMAVEQDGVVIERQFTVVSYEAVALLLNEYEFRTVLDVGCGTQEHARVFRAFDKQVTTIDPVFPADIAGDFLDVNIEGEFDVVFCSHVLEHQRNIGVFLDKLFDIMRDGAILPAISVPPLVHIG